MLTVGDRFPSFSLLAVVPTPSGDIIDTLTHHHGANQWRVLFAWPMDFTFVCPTEIAAFGRRHADFQARNAQLLGLSTDTHLAHLAWRRQHHDLRGLPLTMLADPTRALCSALGILQADAGVAPRATFICDPNDTIRWVHVPHFNVRRSVPEVLRILDALQTNALCPCNWQPGAPTLGS